MYISDFSALLELAATLNIAFVAVEYAKAYTIMLAEKVFKFQDFIVCSFNECKLIDRETLNHLNPVIIAGNSTFAEIEKVKRDQEILAVDIEKTKNDLSGQIHVLCETRSFSTLSLWLFLYCTFALFYAGLEQFYATTPVFWALFTFFTLIYVCLGWSFGECEKQKKYFDFTQLPHCIVYFCICWIICFVLANVIANAECQGLTDVIKSQWNNILIISAILPFSNFGVFVIKIRNKARTVRSQITESAAKIQVRCNQLQDNTQTLININKFCSGLEAK